MKPAVVWLCLLAGGAVVLTGCSRGGDSSLRTHVTAGVPIPDEALAPLMVRHHVPGLSIAVIRGGRIDWAQGYGVREYGQAGRVDSATLFQAASISKPVAAVCALRLVESGALSLDDDVNQKLRSWKVPENEFTRGQPVTLRRLLSHSAGLTMHGVPSFETSGTMPTLVQILSGESSVSAEPVRVTVQPGTAYRYSGGGYIVLQVLLNDVTGRPFERLARDLVLDPARMSSSTFEQPLPQRLRGRAAVGHLGNGTPLRGSWHLYPEQAAGGLWTTPADLARFAIEIWRSYHGLSESLLSRPLARTMLTRQISDFGLGVYLPSVGVYRFQHSGGNVGYRCNLVLSVESGDGVVIMTNGDSGEEVIDEVFQVIAHAYGWQV